MRICFLCPEYPPGSHGGVGTYTQLLARALVRAGHEVRVTGIYTHAYGGADEQDDMGVQVWRLRESAARLGWVSARWQLYRQVAGWARTGAIDLVEAPDSNGWFAGWPRLGVPLVLRAHGSYTYFAHELGRRVAPRTYLLEAASYRRADAWVAVSHHAGVLTQRLFRLREGRPAVIYNPMPVAPAAGSEARDPHRVVFTGTLTPKKGIVALGEAWPAVRRQHPAAALHVYGRDERLPDGRTCSAALLERLPPADRDSVHFHGHVSRDVVLAALRQARVGVFPSFTETCGLGAVESMACGCPTIYTSRTCGPEVVRDEVDGLLVDPAEPAQISRALLRILDDDALAARLAAAGPARVAGAFALPPIVDANLAFYASVRAAGEQS